jgi:hypothetical protein
MLYERLAVRDGQRALFIAECKRWVGAKGLKACSLSVHGRAVKCAGALMDGLPVGWWWVCAGGGVGCVRAGAQPYLGPRSWVLVLDRRHDG